MTQPFSSFSTEDVMDLSEINCKPAKTDNVLPAAFWGLDSTFRSYLKMYITDILALKAMHLVPGEFKTYE